MSSGFSLFSSGAGKKKATRPELPIADVILSGNNLVAAGAGKSASPRVARSGSLEKLGPEEAAIVAQAGRERCEIVPRPVFGDVQNAVIPEVLRGKDVVACSQTGSGKTAAFALPILERLGEDPYGIFAVVLTAGRELAQQIADTFIALGAGMTLRVAVVTGGADTMAQAKELSRMPHIVVATPVRRHSAPCNMCFSAFPPIINGKHCLAMYPARNLTFGFTFTYDGRLAELISKNSTPPKLTNVKYCVLDEADRLLDVSLAPDMDIILNALPPAASGRQTLLFSATMAKNVARAEALALSTPFTWAATQEPTTVGTLREEYVLTPKAVKPCFLLHVLAKAGPSSVLVSEDGGEESSKHKKDRHGRRKRAKPSEGDAEETPRAGSAIVFVATIYTAQFISELLSEMGLLCVCLHSAMNQRRRIAAIAKFKSSLVHVLVATDVASRGLDIPAVELVINYDIPQAPVDYIHRVGRTARAGRGGRAVTFVTQFDVELVQTIEARIGKKLTAMPEVVEEEALKALKSVATAMKVVSMRLVETGFDEALAIVKDRKEASRQRVKEWAEGLGGEPGTHVGTREVEEEEEELEAIAPAPRKSGKRK